MKLYTPAFALAACLMLLQYSLSAIPPVSEDYSNYAAGVHSGKRLNEIIKPEDVSSIALIEVRGKGEPIAEITPRGIRPERIEFESNWNSDELFKRAFAGTAVAENYSLSITERRKGRYALVTKQGHLYLFEVVCDQTRYGAETALIIIGRGFACRIALPEEKATEQDGTGQPATRPLSKPEGSDKPQPEAEGRSR